MINIESSKNHNGIVSRKINAHNVQTLSLYPLDEEDQILIINFKNEKKLNITYVFVINYEIPELNNTIIKQIEGIIEEKKYNLKKLKK